MKCLGLIMILLISVFGGKNNRNLRLGIVNGPAVIKSDGSWKVLTGDDVDLPLNLEDSIKVDGESLFIKETVRSKTKLYQADHGKWSVKQIVEGKAYSTRRAKDPSLESVKGTTDGMYFDILVGGLPTVTFHYGDRPQVRVINDGNAQVYFAPVWIEGESIWRMSSSLEAQPLQAKSSTVESAPEYFVIAPPSGKGRAILLISDSPFRPTDVMRKYGTPEFKFQGLVKEITICE